MPFGAEVLDDGRTRFNLWAPAAETVDLVLEEVPDPASRRQPDDVHGASEIFDLAGFSMPVRA